MKTKKSSRNKFWIENLGGDGPAVAAYLRVSSDKQVKGFSLLAQKEWIRELAKSLNVSRIYWFEDAGETGKEYDRRQLNKILELSESGEIEELLTTDVDRLGRKSGPLLIFYLKLCEQGTVIRTPKRVYTPGDLSSLLTFTVDSYTAEQSNESRTRASVAGKVQGFEGKRWNKSVPKGYSKRADGWIERAPGWGPVVSDTYNLFLESKSFRVVRDAVNRKYSEFLSAPLTCPQIKRMLQNRVYIGKPSYSGEAVRRVLGRDTVVEDLSLAYVDQKTFDKVQEVLDRIHRKHSRRKVYTPRDLASEYGPEILDAVPDVGVLCPDCGGTMVGNGTVIVGNQMARNYLCKRCGKQRKWPTKADTKRVEEWISRHKVRREPRNFKPRTLYDFL